MTDSSQPTQSASYIRDNDDKVVLHPENNDLFMRTGKQIIDACKLGISVSVWLDELQSMFTQVNAWCIERPGKIQACLAQGRGSKMLLLFLPAGRKFDFELATQLAVLNRDLVTRLNIGMVEVGQIPDSDVARFLDTEKAKVIYGKLPEASQPVAT